MCKIDVCDDDCAKPLLATPTKLGVTLAVLVSVTKSEWLCEEYCLTPLGKLRKDLVDILTKSVPRENDFVVLLIISQIFYFVCYVYDI